MALVKVKMMMTRRAHMQDGTSGRGADSSFLSHSTIFLSTRQLLLSIGSYSYSSSHHNHVRWWRILQALISLLITITAALCQATVIGPSQLLLQLRNYAILYVKIRLNKVQSLSNNRRPRKSAIKQDNSTITQKPCISKS